MKLVVDANIVFSALIKKGKTAELFFESELTLFSPEFLFEEVKKHKLDILKKTERTEEDVEKALMVLEKRVDIVKNKDTEKFLAQARSFCPDKGDVDYIALALKLKCPIWSQDKVLRQKQNKVKVWTTEELMRLF